MGVLKRLRAVIRLADDADADGRERLEHRQVTPDLGRISQWWVARHTVVTASGRPVSGSGKTRDAPPPRYPSPDSVSVPARVSAAMYALWLSVAILYTDCIDDSRSCRCTDQSPAKSPRAPSSVGSPI